MLSNIIKSNTKALTDLFSHKEFHRQANGDEGKYKNYLIDLFSRALHYKRGVVVMPKEIVPNDVTLEAFNFVYQKDHSILPILLRYLTHTDLLREAKDDLSEVNQKLQDLMDKEIKNLQIEQKVLRQEIISKLSDEEVNVKQGEEVAEKNAKIIKTASRIKEIELYKEHVRNLLSGEKVISRTYPKEYYSILNDELTKIMEEKLKAYVDDKVDVEKTYQSLNSKSKKIILLRGAKLSAHMTSVGFLIFTPIVQFAVDSAQLYVIAIMSSVAIISLTIAGVLHLANRHYKESFAEELRDFIKGQKHLDKATNTENEKELKQKEEKVEDLIDLSDSEQVFTPSAPALEEERMYPNLKKELDSIRVTHFTPSNTIKQC